MKLKVTFFSLILTAMIAMPSLAQSSSDTANAMDNQSFMAEVSMWYEFHKNNDFESSLNHGWTILNAKPDFTKYKFYRKMDEMLWYMHDSVATTDEETSTVADTILYLYDKAIQYDEKNRPIFLARKAYVLELWHDTPVEEVITAYKEAYNADPDLSDYYLDRLGNLYSENATPENGYKLEALNLYSELAAKDPDNARWPDAMVKLADNPEELVEISKQAWEIDKNNLEKAYSYATYCLRAQMYEESIEPFEFLTQKNPDVINYWTQLATSYDKVGRVDDALKSYKTLIELAPDNGNHYINIAIIYKKLDQLSVARSYLQKAARTNSDWDYPHYIEAQIYEQSARSCTQGNPEFEDKLVYQLAVDAYRKVSRMGGTYASPAAQRVKDLSVVVPQKEDYFFRKLNAGDIVKIKGKCYDWISRDITVPQ